MKVKQYGAIPFRITSRGTEVLLVTTRTKGHWSVPKGWPIKDHPPHKTAEIEAMEEAGLHGEAALVPVGRFTNKRLKHGQPIRCKVDLFPFRVIAEFDNWPERLQRQRQWVDATTATTMVRKPGLKRAIRSLIEAQGRDCAGFSHDEIEVS
ncbi:NUDIX hydrolase [Rhodopseudomonas palustris]|uniref:NUDIX hydrolase n=1 Tax=Rhodopseudomonas palustris TaxID=1076 RepID=UPI00115D674F|nr:NUDIX hydrolase [Rhodopseudomonas palustris]QDL96927.1 NUDIX hydrolase [Rhodopseudomonas palustris]